MRTLEQTNDFIENRFRASYKTFGYGLWAVDLKETGETIGICGFVRRDFLPDADLGFALLPEFERRGYAFESASASMGYGREKLNLKRVFAITSKDNEASGKLLEKLNFKFESLIELPHDAAEVELFSSQRLEIIGN